MDEVRSLLAGLAVADRQTAGLVVGAVGGACHLSPFPLLAAPRHPGLEIKLPVRRPAEIAAGRIDHPIGDPQAVEELALEFEELLVQSIALLGQREGKHLHLRELMDTIEPARGPAMGASLGAEAVADPAEAQGKLRGLEDPLVHRPTEGDLGGGHERQITSGDRVDLRLRAPWHEAGSLEDRVSRQIRGRHDREPPPLEQVDAVPRQRQFEEHAVVGKKVEAVPCHLRPGIEIEELEIRAEVDMVEGLKRELRERRLATPELHRRILAAGRR